jgi:hypothetical protein
MNGVNHQHRASDACGTKSAVRVRRFKNVYYVMAITVFLTVACSGCIAGNVFVQLHYLVEYVTTLLQPQVELTLAEEYSMAGIIDETRRRSIGVACAGRIGRPDPL